MPPSFILPLIAVGLYFVVIITALLIHGIWVAPFIERRGKRTAGFLIWGTLAGVGLIQDFMTARRLCRERGINPRWMKWFASLLVTAGVLAALIIAWILFGLLLRIGVT